MAQHSAVQFVSDRVEPSPPRFFYPYLALDMKIHASSLALLGALLATPAFAQDSVSKLLVPPGDSVRPYLPGEQTNDYVVDMSAFTSSWGTVYGVAPIMKASEDSDFSPGFFTHLVSGQAMSRDILQGVPFLRSSYSYWNGAGFGVNDDPLINDPGTPVDTSAAVGSQFAVSLSDYGFAQAPVGNIITSIVNFDPAAPSRLYVSRIVAASNSPDYTCDLAQFGLGGVDANGQTTIRCDGFGSVDGCGYTATTGDNYYRVDAAGRGALLNVISDTGADDAGATTRLVTNSTTTHVTPTVIPDTLAGGTRLIGTTFANAYVYENPVGTTVSTSAHLAAGVGGTRGSISHSMDNFPGIFGAGQALGTAALLGLNGNGEVAQFALWGIGSTGAPAGTLRIDLPAVMTDPTTGWTSDTLGAGPLEFANHSSQTSFRGGNGQVAIGKDKSGNMLVAAAVSHPNAGGVLNSMTQLIGVARVPAGGGAAQWTVASYNDLTSGVAGTGKALLDGPGGAVIGRLVSHDVMSGGGLPGPSVSCPLIDSHGNLFFIAAIERFVGGTSAFGTGLIRAVYDEATFSYELELVWHSGQVFEGPNSDRQFEIGFVDLADSNSINSAAAFSGNIAAGAYNGADPAALPDKDPRALSGLVIQGSITYDVDQDGDFERQTGGSGNPASDDEDYRVMLYVTLAEDCNGNGIADDSDLAQGTSTDNNGNGVLDDCELPLGTNFCFAVPNSTGNSASISANGSTSVAANLVSLTSQPLPANQPGIHYYGPNQILASFGNGFRCVGGGSTGIARLAVSNSGPAGVLVTVMDLTNPPSAPTQITAGSTWNFQAWYRDPAAGGAFFNLSDGLEITFTP